MIELKHVYKKFGTETVLKDINITFPQYGIVVIYGESGCGKTTLLNVISSLLDFEGEVSFNGKHYSIMKEEDKDILRNTKIGFVFQDYKLFEFESVEKNIMLALDIKSNNSYVDKERRVSDLLKIVGLTKKRNELVSKLSGGEKQRVALARAMSNSPNVLLADEPTGSLDDKNSEMVMKIIEQISTRSLVIIVSHDEKLTKKYADQIIYMKDGEIIKTEYNNHNHHVDVLPLIHITPKEKSPHLPFEFCIHHTFSSIKRRKWRTLLVFMVTSLGLVGVGLGSVLSEIISTNLYKSYSSIIDSTKVIVKPKESNNKRNLITALDYNEVEEIRSEYKENVSSTGVYYWNNVDQMFTDYSFSFDLNGKIKTVPEYRMQHFNEYMKLSNNKGIVYPTQITKMEEDEVILGLTYPLLNEICFQLFITRTTESLSKYLKENELFINIQLDNYLWSYSNAFSLKVRGFSICDKNCFIQSNPLWNEYIFEEKCGFSTTDIISSNSKNPWDLKKSYYLEFKDGRDQFLTDLRFNKRYRYVKGEILDEKYYSLLNKDLTSNLCNRVVLLNDDTQGVIDGFYYSYIKGSSKYIKNIIFGNQNCYAIYPENLMMGFSKSTYLAKDESFIDETIDLTAYIKYEESFNISMPENVVEGHFTKSNMQGLIFNPNYNLISGRKPNTYEEIVISKALVDKLNILEPVGKSVFISFPLKEELLPNGYLSRDYKTVELKITGISDSSKLEISHKEEWSLMFFQIMMGISVFNLNIDSLAIEVEENYENAVINSLKRSFPNFEASSPISGVKDSINTVCGYIEKILLVFSISSIVIASLLLMICNYLHFVEIKKDIGLVRCIGITKQESSKFIFVHSFIMALFSLLISIVQLLFICFFLSRTFSSLFIIESTFVFNPMSIVYMLFVAIFISFISSITIKRRINKLNPLDCLR